MAMRWRGWESRRAQSFTPDQLLVPMKKKVWWSFSVALALLALIGATAYTEVVKLRANDAWVDHTHQVISSLRKIQSLVADAETGQRGYLITGDSSYLKPYNEALLNMDGELAVDQILRENGSWEGELLQRTESGDRVYAFSQWVLHRIAEAAEPPFAVVRAKCGPALLPCCNHRASPRRDAHGTPSRILEVNADITACRHAEELQTRSQKLEALGRWPAASRTTSIIFCWPSTGTPIWPWPISQRNIRRCKA